MANAHINDQKSSISFGKKKLNISKEIAFPYLQNFKKIQ